MEKDVSVRQQAVDLLYAMCDKSNAEEIVQEMLNYLETADYSIREEMVWHCLFSLLYGHQTSASLILIIFLNCIVGSEGGYLG